MSGCACLSSFLLAAVAASILAGTACTLSTAAPSDGGGATNVDGGGALVADGGNVSVADGGAVVDGGVSLADGGASVVDGGATPPDGGVLPADGGECPQRDAGADVDGGAVAHLIGTIYSDENSDFPVEGVTVAVQGCNAPAPVITDASGGYGFYFSVGDNVLMRADKAGLIPMLRGRIAKVNDRPRNFKMHDWAFFDQLWAAAVDGGAPDRTKGIVSIVFRNADGAKSYCATVRGGDGGVVPIQAAMYTTGEQAHVTQERCIQPGASQTLTLFGVAVGEVTFEATQGATGNACILCDANPMPVAPGVVTKFEFECNLNRGNDTCQ